MAGVTETDTNAGTGITQRNVDDSGIKSAKSSTRTKIRLICARILWLDFRIGKNPEKGYLHAERAALRWALKEAGVDVSDPMAPVWFPEEVEDLWDDVSPQEGRTIEGDIEHMAQLVYGRSS